MTTWIDLILIGLALSNLVLVGSSRIGVCIRMVALQGILLGLLPLASHHWLLAAASMAIKGAAFPWLLFRAMREANVRREVEPYVGFSASLLIGVAALGVSSWLATRLPPSNPATSSLVLPVALFTMLTGLFLIVGRRQALTQVIGYLALENGVFAFGLGLVREAPLVVEMGILLDIFVAVFVMGIAIFHISRAFDQIDTDQLTALKDTPS
ncbi:MAG: hydrogenase [Kiritimatiellae bacterium]|nr:hydrogenase [Kiritimatiellia bacterium]